VTMQLPIDPSHINHDNLPQVVGAMAIMVHENYVTTKKIESKFVEYDRCFSLLKFSLCSALPWVRRHKFGLTSAFLGVSLWFSALDWLNRWLQWSILPPGTGP
jgi:hypothetical protein